MQRRERSDAKSQHGEEAERKVWDEYNARVAQIAQRKVDQDKLANVSSGGGLVAVVDSQCASHDALGSCAFSAGAVVVASGVPNPHSEEYRKRERKDRSEEYRKRRKMDAEARAQRREVAAR
mmetsp:Transcript_32830/g.89910  ORF Transcript_32830/g.89910 Transcript_32830/m.89910 type:complete len:122 (-) Transcript_32830:215-580(-)